MVMIHPTSLGDGCAYPRRAIIRMLTPVVRESEPARELVQPVHPVQPDVAHELLPNLAPTRKRLDQTLTSGLMFL